MVKNLPSKAGDEGSIPSQGTKTPHAMGQLSQHTANREQPMYCNKDPVHQKKIFLIKKNKNEKRNLPVKFLRHGS